MHGLAIIVSWIYDLLIFGNDENEKNLKKEIMQRFDCEDGGELKEHAGWKLDWKEDVIKINQPILTQNIEDDFDM